MIRIRWKHPPAINAKRGGCPARVRLMGELLASGYEFVFRGGEPAMVWHVKRPEPK